MSHKIIKIKTTHPSKMVRAKQNGPPTNRQTFLQDYARCHQNNTNSVISTAQHRHLILTYYVLRQTHTTNSFVIAHYANRPHNPPNITHVVQVEKTGSDNQNESRKTFHTETAPGAICSHQIQLIVRWLNPVSPPFDAGSGEVAVETIPHICHFFTRAKFLDKKIYTEKRQFFALNL